MPDYCFHLHPVGAVKPELETVSAHDDEEARTLAQMRLLLSAAFSSVTVSRSGMEPMNFSRDRAFKASNPSQGTTAAL